MISIIYPYRNRELSRIERSLNSLSNQTCKNFKVVLIDYGSEFTMANSVKALVRQYDFVDYFYTYHCHQPWSRAKAVNIGLKLIDTDYVFVADIDMIFRYDFIEKLQHLKNPNQAIFFKVGFLDENETRQIKPFSDYNIGFVSQVGAQGLSLFPTDALKAVNGFDEFLHFWGAEDEDVHSRLALSGVEVVFFNTEILLLHQWHQSYRQSAQITLTKDLQLTNITRLNMQHQLHNKTTKTTIVNRAGWGEIITKNDYEGLENHLVTLEVSNKKESIEHFLYFELPHFSGGVLNVNFIDDRIQGTVKYQIKKIIGKSVSSYYSLKEINDMVLLHLISFYSSANYSFKISNNLKSINFKIHKK